MLPISKISVDFREFSHLQGYIRGKKLFLKVILQSN